MKPTPLYKRLLNNLEISPNGCWLWAGWKDRDGYGRMTIMHGKRWKSEIVPRVAFVHFNGPIKEGGLVCHNCDTPACFKPSHLYQGTFQSNMDDKVMRGRANPPVGERAGAAKLSELQVKEIRSKYATGDFTQRALASEYGVGFKAICKIVHFQRWKHV